MGEAPLGFAGNRLRCNSAASSNSRLVISCPTSSEALRALRMAKAAELLNSCNKVRSASSNRPSPACLLISSMAPIHSSLTPSGAHRIERW